MADNSKCRFCNNDLEHIFVDLGMSPLCESFLHKNQLNQMEPFYPLKVYVCSNCYLVQLEEYVSPEEIFTEYAYFSSYADTWLQHAKDYVELMIERFGINGNSRVIEIASNDGYLLQYFLEHAIPVLGIEPAKNVADVAIKKGITTITEFFGTELAQELVQNQTRADLLLGNNVLAQVPDINDFVKGMQTVLKPGGVITMEFPHLLSLIDENQFDTIYHEHFSYFSFFTVEKIFAAHGIVLFDVELLPTHGGSLRIYGRHEADNSKPVTENVVNLKAREMERGIDDLELYNGFSEKVKETKRRILSLLIEARKLGKRIVGYGAPGKGNTLLNYCGIRSDLLDYTVDRNPYKHGRFTPGTHIEIFAPEKIQQDRPDYLFILPWNFKDEIINQMDFISEWDGKFIIPIPEAKVVKL